MTPSDTTKLESKTAVVSGSNVRNADEDGTCSQTMPVLAPESIVDAVVWGSSRMVQTVSVLALVLVDTRTVFVVVVPESCAKATFSVTAVVVVVLLLVAVLDPTTSAGAEGGGLAGTDAAGGLGGGAATDESAAAAGGGDAGTVGVVLRASSISAMPFSNSVSPLLSKASTF